MISKRYLSIALILLVILGIFLTIGIINSRHTMMALIKDQARSFLSIVAAAQETSIFAEGTYEDEIVEQLINICNYIDASGLNAQLIENVRKNFKLNAITITGATSEKIRARSGYPMSSEQVDTDGNERISYEYFKVGTMKVMQFRYEIADRVYWIELSAQNIQIFRKEFGINKITDQLTVNPMVKYLVLQDRDGILYATPNIQTISRIEDDSMLLNVIEEQKETSRIIVFEDSNILEIARPFVVDGTTFGIFRIGISLESYYRHLRSTERQLVMLFIILFGAGFVLLFLFLKYQSYIDLKNVFDKTLGAVEDAVLMVNANGIINGANTAFCAMSSFEEQGLLRQDYVSLFKEDPFEIRKVLDSRSKVVNEKQVFSKNVQYATYPLFDKKKRIAGAITVLRDVTTLRAFEKEREEAERLAFLGNLVANFAHEIKNPLNGLSIATQRLIKEFSEGDDEYKHLTHTIKKEIESLDKILNDFLVLARPKMRVKEQFNASDIIQDVLNVIREQAKNNKILLKENIKKGIKLAGNGEDFKRAVLNLLINACDAVTTARIRSPEVTIRMKDAPVTLIIADNGTGMDDEEKERIFTPYFTTKQKGTGLGLYIAQKILKDHGGVIDVETEKDKGTTFTIVFHHSL
jgi:signal transduction histidine kinase